MTLEEIGDGIEKNHKDWIKLHQAEVEKVTDNRGIKTRIVRFIEEAARHPTAIVGNPRQAVEKAMRLSALANFRFGLLVGFLLYHPPELEIVTERCDTCDGSGSVCIRCGKPHLDCTCQKDTEIAYSPVVCEGCDGSGRMRTK